MDSRDSIAEQKDVNVEDALQSLPGLGYLDDDIQAQLTETAKSISQDIVDFYSAQYREARRKNGGNATLPEKMWKPLKGKAYQLAAKHCEELASDLMEASKNPNMKL
ncbi:MAG: hypothetical protein AAF901_12510 [Bacteroidota bacterium]